MFQRSLERLTESTEQVHIMQKSIESLEPKIKIAVERVAKQISEVQSAVEAVDEMRETIKKEEQITIEKTTIATELGDEYKSLMEETTSGIREADNAVAALTHIDINSVRTMKNAPLSVKIVMEGVCILKDIKIEKPNASTDDYWSQAKKMLNDPRFIESILNFDKNAIPEHVSKKLNEKIISNETFDPEKVKSLSSACETMAKWIIAIAEYDKVARENSTKCDALREAESLRDVASSSLQAKENELRILEENLTRMQKQLSMDRDKSERLKMEHENCSKRLIRATEIVGCLSGEKERWQKEKNFVQNKMLTILSDVLIGTGIVSYLSQFPELYRKQLIEDWFEKCTSFGLSCNK